MLVLSRHRNEGIWIGDVHLVVIDIKGDKVRLGVDAPKEVPVYRDEVKAAIEQAENTKGQDDETDHLHIDAN